MKAWKLTLLFLLGSMLGLQAQTAEALYQWPIEGAKLAKEFFIGRRNISTMSITLTDCSLEQNWVPT